MNIVKFYEQIPVERHQEIVISGDRLFLDGEEYVIGGDGDLRLVRSNKQLLQKVEQISTKLNIVT